MSAAARAPLEIARFEIRPLADEHGAAVDAFACGDDDLDDFLRSDALRLQDQNVVRTYVAFHESELVGYIALLADAVELKPAERKRISLRFQDHPVVPALKIARLAVSTAAQKRFRGVGTELVRFARAMALSLSRRVGFRLLTLDAYPQSIGFYEGLGFIRNQANVYQERKRPSMRLDVFAPNPPAWISRTESQGPGPGDASSGA